jgi:hypothetical protein
MTWPQLRSSDYHTTDSSPARSTGELQVACAQFSINMFDFDRDFRFLDRMDNNLGSVGGSVVGAGEPGLISDRQSTPLTRML